MQSKDIYIYTINNNGEVVERSGTINHRTEKAVVASVSGGQRLLLHRCADTIHNDAMWSYKPHKCFYAEKMLDILVERRASFQNSLDATTRRINNIRKYAG